MEYRRIGGPMSFSPTGNQCNCYGPLKSGKRMLEEFESAPIDAPEAIPAGSSQRAEWPDFDGRICWFPAPTLILRSYS